MPLKLLMALACCACCRVEGGRKIFCYYSSSANDRPGVGKFWPENIDPFLCTHLIFAFVGLTEDGLDLRPNNWNDLGPSGLYTRTLTMKKINPKLKILMAVGGWRIGSRPFLPMIRTRDSMKTWVGNVVKYLRKYGFDGLDVDWEFPGFRGSKYEDKYKFTFLLKELCEVFDGEAKKTGREKLLLTLATASSSFYIEKSYEKEKIIKYIDYMLLMTYNYHGSGWEKVTGHPSPLWSHPLDPPGEQQELHQQWSIDFWLKGGVLPKKLIVGIPTYGLTFKLKDPSNHGIRAPAVGGGEKGKYTGEKGILSYYEICEKIQHEEWQVEWIREQDVPLAFGNNEWVGFENPASLRVKANNIVARGLGGAFVWSLEMDDFTGHCGHGPYPLLNLVSAVLQPVFDADETFSSDAGAEPQRNVKFDCNKLGLGIFHDPQSCRHFFFCVPADTNGLRAIKMSCPKATRFDKNLKICNHSHRIICW